MSAYQRVVKFMSGVHMPGHSAVLRVAFVALTLFAASCVAERASAGTAAEPVDSYAGLLDTLREQGASVEIVGPISQPFFIPEGTVISVDGQEVQVFAFSSKSELESAVETISADGSAVGTSMIFWVAEPHFYRSGNLLVLYIGAEEGVIQLLEAVLGPQIAGRNR